MGNEALAAGDAEMAGPTSNTVMPTQALRRLDTADWIVFMGNSTLFFFVTET
jgi:uncharacterized ion transporter superfamily protein YfcC